MSSYQFFDIFKGASNKKKEDKESILQSKLTPKKILPDTFLGVIVGKPGSVKTTLINSLLQSPQAYKNHFDYVLFISPYTIDSIPYDPSYFSHVFSVDWIMERIKFFKDLDDLADTQKRRRNSGMNTSPEDEKAEDEEQDYGEINEGEGRDEDTYYNKGIINANNNINNYNRGKHDTTDVNVSDEEGATNYAKSKNEYNNNDDEIYSNSTKATDHDRSVIGKRGNAESLDMPEADTDDFSSYINKLEQLVKKLKQDPQYTSRTTANKNNNDDDNDNDDRANKDEEINMNKAKMSEKKKASSSKKPHVPAPKKRALVVLDDVVADIKKNEFNRDFVNLIFNRRNIIKGVEISILITTQKYTMIPQKLRYNTTWLIVFPVPPQDLKNICNEQVYQNVKGLADGIKKHYDESMHNFLFIRLDINQMFLNFTKII